MNSESSDSSFFRQLKIFFIPSALATILYLLINLILLSILNMRGLWDIFISPSTGAVNSQDISSLTDAFNSMQAKLDTPFIFLFWIFIGCVSYGIIWGLQNTVVVSKKEVKESHFTNEPSPPNYWQSIMTTNLLLLTSAVGTAIYAFFYLRYILPGFARLFHDGLYNPSHYRGLVDILGSILVSAAAVYILVLLCRVLRYHWHTIRPV